MIDSRCLFPPVSGISRVQVFLHLANKRFKQALAGYLLPLPVGVLGSVDVSPIMYFEW
jgi:hypothetical protein